LFRPSYCYLTLDDEKWAGRLIALGMAQGTYPMDDITSAKFRIFLAERAVNYVFVANVAANILLTNTNIGCPNISFGPSILFLCDANVDCELYEYMASRTLDKVVRLFEGGQSEILKDIVIDEEPKPEDELDELGNWDDLKGKMENGDMEKFLEVGIGTGADDSEWFRVK
jgi:hypothetical protein